MRVGRRQRVVGGSQTPVPWRLSRSVIDSVGPAGAEFARNADYFPGPQAGVWPARGGLREPSPAAVADALGMAAPDPARAPGTQPTLARPGDPGGAGSTAPLCQAHTV